MPVHRLAPELAAYINEKAAVLESMGYPAEALELTGLADKITAGDVIYPLRAKPRPPVLLCLFPEQHIVVRTDLPNPKLHSGIWANRHKRVNTYRSGMSVACYLKATATIGGQIADLWWDERDGLIKVVSPEAYAEMETA